MTPHGESSPCGSEKAHPWCPYQSVLSVSLQCPEKPLPFEPPFGRYLSEVLSGLKAGPGDRGDAEARQGGQKLVAYVSLLGALVGQAQEDATPLARASEAAERACGLLFWICVGVVFSRAPYPQALSFLRSELARAWYLIALETKRATPADREKRDWLMDAWPYIFAQATYRMLFDAFEEDKETLMRQGTDLLDKFSRVAHFEALGFQMDRETARKARKRLFLRRVVQNPETDQFTFLEGLARRQRLETTLEEASGQGLSFALSPDGDEKKVDEHQLEDLWDNMQQGKFQGKERWSPKQSNGLAGGRSQPGEQVNENRHTERAKAFLLRKRSAWTPTESVSRHQILTLESDDLYKQQMMQVADMFDSDSDDEAPGNADGGEAGSDCDLPPQPRIGASWSSPILSPHGDRGDMSTPTTPDAKGVGRASTFVTSDNLASERGKTRWRKARGGTPMTVMMTANERKAKKELEKATRQKELSLKIAEPLPDDLRRKEMNTTWVSPLTKGLCPDAQDRLLLKKRDAEAWRLKMTTNRRAMQTSVSVPNLRRKAPPERRAPLELAQDDLRCTSAGSNSGRPGSNPGGLACRASSLGRGDSMVFPSSPGGRSSSKGSPGQRFPGKEQPAEVIDFGAVANLHNKGIMQRLESQARACQMNTFSEYMKGVNILTGERKTHIDGDQLRRDEDLTIAQSHALLGGSPLKMHSLSKIIAAQAGAGLGGGSKAEPSRSHKRDKRGH